MDLPVMEVDNGNDGGNVLPEEASLLAEVGELVGSDEFEGGDGLDDDSVRELFVQYYRDCFSTLCDVLGECLGEYDYPGDFLATANLEERESEAVEALESLDADDVAEFSDRTLVCTFTETLVRKFVHSVVAFCLAVFVTSLPEMVLEEILTAEFCEVKEKAIADAVAVLVGGLETAEIEAVESAKWEFAEVVTNFMITDVVVGCGQHYSDLVAAMDASYAAASDDKENLSADVLEARALGEEMRADLGPREALGPLYLN